MKSLFYLSITLFLVSCGTSEGDVYENLMTEERIKIEKIGKCGELEEFYEMINQAFREGSNESESSLKEAGIIRVILNNAGEQNKNEKCFVFTTDLVRLSRGRYFAASAQINLLSTLSEDYRRIK